MMRRARACLPLFAFVASLAAMACGGETIPPARESGASAFHCHRNRALDAGADCHTDRCAHCHAQPQRFAHADDRHRDAHARTDAGADGHSDPLARGQAHT